MNKEELNKKLTEWAGLCWHEWIFSPPLYKRAECSKCGQSGWFEGFNPNDHKEYNFTQSLDACFELLVPKLIERNYELSLHRFIDEGDWSANLWSDYEPYVDISISDKEPALAFCLAIEELIDSTKL